MADVPWTMRVDCGDGAVMTIENPRADHFIDWTLRYGNVEQTRYVAASLLECYDYLCSDNISLKEAVRRLKLLRKAWKESADG